MNPIAETASKIQAPEVEIDHSVGAELHENAPAMFAYDFDLLVPKQRGTEGPWVAVGFDQARLAECCQTVREYVEVGGNAKPLPPMVLGTPASHHSSVRGFLSCLVPPGPSPAVPVADLADMVSVADYLCLDSLHSAALNKIYSDRVKTASLSDLVQLLEVSRGQDHRTALDRILQKLDSAEERITLAGVAHKLGVEDLREILASPAFSTNEDAVWAILSAWWLHHEKTAWPTPAALAAKDLGTSIRWHLLSEQQFNQCANHGCLPWKVYDEWVVVRCRLASINAKYHNGLEATVAGQTFPARCQLREMPSRFCLNPQTNKYDPGVNCQYRSDFEYVCMGSKFSVDAISNYVKVTPVPAAPQMQCVPVPRALRPAMPGDFPEPRHTAPHI